ncbi:DUF642 domain-containing protein [Ideonella sp. A 288]|uniref:DUF642 domain-containing protein n=1 Tax=Ideonella sp. A 288 TaxID=1962181 RepID=UPI0013039CFE|nr:DUF642 domain-containing protein [Ideonella sp. A 288]
MLRFQSVVFSSLLTVSAGSWAAGPNLLVNGSFEAPNAVTISCYQNAVAGNWTSFGPTTNKGSCAVESGYSSAGLTWPIARDGTQMWFVNFQNVVGTKIAQTISLVANTQYTLTFSLAGIDGNAVAPNVNVAIGNGVGSRNFTSTAGASWTDLAWSFTPLTTGSTTVAFTAAAGPVNLDAAYLQVGAVPEATTTSMMAAGLVILLGIAARRRKGRQV